MLGMKRGREKRATGMLADVEQYLDSLYGRPIATLRFTIESPLLGKAATFDEASNYQLQDVIEMVNSYGWTIQQMAITQSATVNQMGVQNTSKETYTLILSSGV